MFEKQYRCDNWYFPGSCKGMGNPDESREFGKISKYYRLECLTDGTSPFTGEPCRHCLYSTNGRTWHWLAKIRRIPKNSKCVVIVKAIGA
jgi:hypothetical protein